MRSSWLYFAFLEVSSLGGPGFRVRRRVFRVRGFWVRDIGFRVEGLGLGFYPKALKTILGFLGEVLGCGSHGLESHSQGPGAVG